MSINRAILLRMTG